MSTGLLHLHNLLRWVVLITLLLSIVKLITGQNALKTSKILLINAHTTLVLGLYQYFFGAVGYALIKNTVGGMKEVMKDGAARFWAVEHISSMILAIVLITVGHIRLKNGSKASTTATLYLIALLLILSAIPWPFRTGIGRPWLPGL
ncbi:MAG: hypothetical protein RIR64_1224 [Bacteroidota bacterium]|jgi:hypothetical protein